jgi:lipoprotein-anchoring transpeptidase ErfK/SrfK
MHKPLKNKIIPPLLIGLFLCGNAYAASKKKEDVVLPVQLKEKRLKQLQKIADEKIRDEKYPFTSEDDFFDIIKKQQLEDKVVSGQIINEKIKKQYRTIQVSTNPSANFKTLNLAPNFSTTLIFLDKLGNPWSIEKFIVGSAENYNPEIQDANMITFTPKTKADNTNLTVIFKNGDNNTAISFNLNITSEIVDFISEITIDGYGDNSPKETETNFINTGGSLNKNNELLYLSKDEKTFMSEIISNTLPSGFSEFYAYSSDGKQKEDYRIFHKENDKFLYIRTKHKIISPNPVKQRNGIDKTIKVIKIPYTTSLWVEEFGRLININIRKI